MHLVDNDSCCSPVVACGVATAAAHDPDLVVDLPVPAGPARSVRRYPKAAGWISTALSLLIHSALLATLLLTVPIARPRADVASGAAGVATIHAPDAESAVIDVTAFGDAVPLPVAAEFQPLVIEAPPPPPPARFPEVATPDAARVDPALSTQSDAAIASGRDGGIPAPPPNLSRRPPLPGVADDSAGAEGSGTTEETTSTLAAKGSPDAATAANDRPPGSPSAASAGPPSVDPGRLTPRPGNRRPAYPRLAERARLEGTVQVRLIVEPDGRVSDIRIAKSSGHDILDRAALDALGSWRFDPTAAPQAVSVAQEFAFSPNPR